MARVSSKGSIVIPADIREEYGIKPGDEVDIVDDGDCIVVVPHNGDPVGALKGMFRLGSSLTKSLLDDRHAEKDREERSIVTGAHSDPDRKPGAAAND